MPLTDRLIHHIRVNLATDHDDTPIGPETPLLDQGIIDSMGLLSLVTFIEDQTGVRVPDEEVMPDNFQDIASIEAMVERLRGR
jgi:acyl carrier protein